MGIEGLGIERRYAMHFTKTRCSGHAQQFFEDLGSNTFPSIFWSDVQLEDLSGRKVQCAKSYGHRSVLGYDDVSFPNVFLVPLWGPPS